MRKRGYSGVLEGSRYDREHTRFSVEHTTVSAKMYVVAEGKRKRERVRGGEGDRRTERSVRVEQAAKARGGRERRRWKRRDNPVRARWNENAVTRNKRGGDPKLLVEVQPEGLGMSLRRGGDETLP